MNIQNPKYFHMEVILNKEMIYSFSYTASVECEEPFPNEMEFIKALIENIEFVKSAHLSQYQELYDASSKSFDMFLSILLTKDRKQIKREFNYSFSIPYSEGLLEVMMKFSRPFVDLTKPTKPRQSRIPIKENSNESNEGT